MNDRQEQIRIKVGFAILDQSNQTLESHAGIDILMRQFFVLTAGHFTRAAVIL